MRKLRLAGFVVCAFAVARGTGLAETREINVASQYGVTQDGIARAIEEARQDFRARPDDTVVLAFAAGTYDLSNGTNGKGAIDVSNIQPGDRGRLVFRGAGSGQTTLVLNKDFDWIYGRNVYRVSFIGLHMTTRQYTESQGHVVEAGPGFVILDIQDGFPSPGQLFNNDRQQGRYLRRYTDSRTDPHLIETDNDQVPWVSAEPVSGSQWRIDLKRRRRDAPDYRKGDLVCIKSKPDGNTYWFYGGSDIVFDDVKWTQMARGVFRGGIGKVRISNSVVERAPPIRGQTPCLSTPGGGPQFGQPNDPPSTDDVVENSRFTATGDDSVAFFNASGVVRNSSISDSFGRGILLYNSPGVTLENDQVVRCPVLKKAGD